MNKPESPGTIPHMCGFFVLEISERQFNSIVEGVVFALDNTNELRRLPCEVVCKVLPKMDKTRTFNSL